MHHAVAWLLLSQVCRLYHEELLREPASGVHTGTFQRRTDVSQSEKCWGMSKKYQRWMGIFCVLPASIFTDLCLCPTQIVFSVCKTVVNKRRFFLFSFAVFITKARAVSTSAPACLSEGRPSASSSWPEFVQRCSWRNDEKRHHLHTKGGTPARLPR